VDLAISTKSEADWTAAVVMPCNSRGEGDDIADIA
jgi:hypothetical protein